ncbi:MAG TPA: ATP-grasp domain-containing protein [Pyrinomonadaceae bacterium]|nr:ATP-grasp domain-containing protein [Pyrinomonadaceae bacterium]
METSQKDLALVYNLRLDYQPQFEGEPSDLSADWDIPDTVALLRDGLTGIGYNVLDFRYGPDTPQELVKANALIFSICEMAGGSYRESLIPSFCELYGLPYVFSEPDVMLKTLDKNLTNFLVKQLGVSTPDWIYIQTPSDIEATSGLSDYPYIVKPAHEGSGIGISETSIAHSHAELKEHLSSMFNLYRRPMIVQRFITGTEVTIGLTGSEGEVEVFDPIEVVLLNSPVYGFDVKENSGDRAQYVRIDDLRLAKKIRSASEIIFNGLACRDAARIDFRVDPSGEIYFIEINPLPHLHPEIGDFCRSAAAAGVTYSELLTKIMRSANRRLG